MCVALPQLNDGTEPVEPEESHANSTASSLFIDEPLYQIYHAGVVARDVIGQSGEAEDDDGTFFSFQNVFSFMHVYSELFLRQIILYTPHEQFTTYMPMPPGVIYCFSADYDDYYAIYEEAESVKSYVSSILSKGATVPTAASRDDAVEQASSLEKVAKLGAGVRKLWCEMPQV